MKRFNKWILLFQVFGLIVFTFNLVYYVDDASRSVSFMGFPTFLLLVIFEMKKLRKKTRKNKYDYLLGGE